MVAILIRAHRSRSNNTHHNRRRDTHSKNTDHTNISEPHKNQKQYFLFSAKKNLVTLIESQFQRSSQTNVFQSIIHKILLRFSLFAASPPMIIEVCCCFNIVSKNFQTHRSTKTNRSAAACVAFTSLYFFGSATEKKTDPTGWKTGKKHTKRYTECSAEANEHCATTVKSKQSINIFVVYFLYAVCFLICVLCSSFGGRKKIIISNPTNEKKSSLTCRFGHSKPIKHSSRIFSLSLSTLSFSKLSQHIKSPAYMYMCPHACIC